MLTIAPPPRSAMLGITACMPSRHPIWFTSMTRRYCSRVIEAIGAISRMPPLLTSTPRGPQPSVAAPPAAPPALGVLGVGGPTGARGADGGGGPFAVGVEDVAEHDARALGGEQPRLRLALPARRAGDQRDLAVEPPHQRAAARGA